MMRPGLDNGFLPNGAGPLPGASLAEMEGVFGFITLDDFVALQAGVPLPKSCICVCIVLGIHASDF